MELNYTTDYWLTTINTYIKNTYINFNKKKKYYHVPVVNSTTVRSRPQRPLQTYKGGNGIFFKLHIFI
jgi:hypothetical protein